MSKKTIKQPAGLAVETAVFRCVRDCLTSVTPGGRSRPFTKGVEMTMPADWSHSHFERVDDDESLSEEEREAQVHAQLVSQALASGAADECRQWSIAQLSHFLSARSGGSGGKIRPQDLATEGA
jgi:hypothetical protein